MTNTWFGVITAVRDDCGKGDEKAVIIGKAYPLTVDASGCIYFIDEDGEKNYGCDNEDDSSYEFIEYSLTQPTEVDKVTT